MRGSPDQLPLILMATKKDETMSSNAGRTKGVRRGVTLAGMEVVGGEAGKVEGEEGRRKSKSRKSDRETEALASGGKGQGTIPHHPSFPLAQGRQGARIMSSVVVIIPAMCFPTLFGGQAAESVHSHVMTIVTLTPETCMIYGCPSSVSYDALEPNIDARTMEVRRTKHHAGYVAT